MVVGLDLFGLLNRIDALQKLKFRFDCVYVVEVSYLIFCLPISLLHLLNLLTVLVNLRDSVPILINFLKQESADIFFSHCLNLPQPDLPNTDIRKPQRILGPLPYLLSSKLLMDR